jgi:uracil-DNA glycosylase
VAGDHASLLIIGQAPGIRVHQSGIPWDDASGNRLRDWLEISASDFYDNSKVAIVPMGFCYPGSGPSGDLPPRPECASLWHDRLLGELTNVQLTLLIGRYAQQHVLGKTVHSNLTETVRHWKDYRPKSIPLPHPSPRNNRWLRNNPWFQSDVLPEVRSRVRKIVGEI